MVRGLRQSAGSYALAMGQPLPEPAERKPRAKPVRRGHPEQDFQIPLVKWLRLVLPAGSKVARVQNEEQPKSTNPWARIAFVRRRIAMGTVPGWPDLDLIFPLMFANPECPRAEAMIECKSLDGPVSDIQLKLHKELRALDIPVLSAARTIEHVEAFLCEINIPLRICNFT